MASKQGRVELGLGSSEFRQGNLKAAYEHWTQAIELCRAERDLQGQLQTLANMAELLRVSGRPSQALATIDTALNLLRKSGYERREGPYRHTKGMILLDMSKYVDAQDEFEQAELKFREIGNRAEEALQMTHIGVALQHQQRFPQATEHFRRAEAVYREIGDKLGLADCLVFLGHMFVTRKDRKAMRAYLDEAIQIFREKGKHDRVSNVEGILTHYLEILS